MKRRKIEQLRAMINNMKPSYHIDLATGKYYFDADEITEQQFLEAENKYVKISLGSGIKPE